MSGVRGAALVAVLSLACGEEPPVPAGAECAPDLFATTSGCYGRHCRACTEVSECEPTEACAGGTCGACSEDGECSTGRRCLSGFCVEASPPAWNLEVDEADYAKIVADPYQEIFVPCALEADGVRYEEGCEVRIRGGSSRDFSKKSFRIKFPEDAPHPGYTRKINLRAEYNDSTFLRSLAAEEAFRRFTALPVPRRRFIQLALDGEPYGLMLEVERIGRAFLERNGRAETSLYEADPPRDLFATGGGSLIPLPDDTTYRAAYQKTVGTPFDYSDLIGLIESLAEDHRDGGASESVRALLRVPDLLDYLAVMAAIQNSDHVRKNYYLSEQAEGWEIYPWDLDLSFGCLYDEVGGDTICDRFTYEANPVLGLIPSGVEPIHPMEGHRNLLIHLALTDEQLRPGFDCRLCAIIDSPFWETRLEELLSAVASAIEPFVAADASDLNGTIEDWRARVEEMKSFARARADHLRRTLCER